MFEARTPDGFVAGCHRAEGQSDPNCRRRVVRRRCSPPVRPAQEIIAMTIERIPITSREQWLELRKPDVTASVVGALFAAHPYMTALKLYLMHQGIDFPV